MDRFYVTACYHPTTFLFIDDDAIYLNKLGLIINPNKISGKLFSNSHEALKYLESYSPNSFTKRCVKRPEEINFDQRIIDVYIKKIWLEVYNAARFKEISVIVIDYAMPGMNGVDFARQCKKFKNTNFKILMLTGEADEQLAIQSFNDGLIHKFIRKNAPDFEVILNAVINALQEEYFFDLSALLIDSLIKNPEHSMISWLDEPVFFSFFAELIKKHDLREYYLSDAFGSFMFLDFEGNPSWLAVKSEEEMQAAYEVAACADKEISQSILQKMHDKAFVLYLHEDSGLTSESSVLKKSLHPASVLVGNKSNYYYAYITDPTACQIDKSNIFSYKRYRESLFNVK